MCELKLVRAVRLVIQQEPVRFRFIGTDFEVGYVTMVRSIAKKIVYQTKVVLLWTFIDRSITFKNLIVLQKRKPEPSLILGSERSAMMRYQRTRENRKSGRQTPGEVRRGRRPVCNEPGSNLFGGFYRSN